MEDCRERLKNATILDILNEDCWRAILDLLHLRDIIRSERVSHQWQYVILQYLQGALFSIEYPWYKHETHSKFRILTMDNDDQEKLDRVTRKWGPYIKTADCVNKASLKVIRRNCPNVEDITFYGLQDDVLSNEQLKNYKKLKRVHFRSCHYISDKCISRWLSSGTIEDLAISDSERVTGRCLTNLQPNQLKTLCLRECEALDFHQLLSAADHLTGLTKLELAYIPKDIFQNVHLLLNKIPNMEDLCLCWQKKMELGDELVESVGRLGRLRRLDLRFNPNASDEWLEVVARGCRLQELLVEGCLGVGPRGLAAVCRASGPALRALHAGSNGKVEDRHVAAFIAACPNLTYVDVSYCRAVSAHVVDVAAGAARGRRRRLRLRVQSTAVRDTNEKMPELKSMGELAETPPEDHREAFQAVVASIDEHYPNNWRDWSVYNYSFQDLFGGAQIPTAVDIKIRFAIPTTDLARAFEPEATSLSERAFRSIRHLLLKWPLGRALLYAPHSLMEKIHSPCYDLFMNTVREIKPKLLKRLEASEKLRESSTTMTPAHACRKRVLEASPSSSPIKRPNRAPSPQSSRRPSEGSSDHLLATVLNQQMKLFDRMLSLQAEQNENIKKLVSNQGQLSKDSPEASGASTDLDQSFESLPDSTESECLDNPKSNGDAVSKEEELRNRIAEAQRELAALQNNSDTEIAFDFAPSTTEKEARIAKADAKAIEHGTNCQKLGQDGWANIRYADLQKQFQATPIFSSLKVNNILAEVSPSWKSTEILERFDMALGAITHGLIQERIIFQSLLDSLPKEIKSRVGKDYVLADSAFRQKSDSLIQYTCGRRAEVIKNRRDIFKPRTASFRGIMRDIPPSQTHLFEDKALSDAVKEQGGIDKFFPKKYKQGTTHKTNAQITKPRYRDIRMQRQGAEARTRRGKPFQGTKNQRQDRSEHPRKPFNAGGQTGKKMGRRSKVTRSVRAAYNAT